MDEHDPTEHDDTEGLTFAAEPTPPTILPDWVVAEVGRLHLDNLALRRDLEARDRQG